VARGVTGSTDWFPAPPPRPLKAPSALKIAAVIALACAAAGGVAVMSLTSHGHATPKAATPAALARGAGETHAAREQGLASCMRSIGGTRSASPFSRGPSKQLRNAFAICRSLLRPPAAPPSVPVQAPPSSAPVA